MAGLSFIFDWSDVKDKCALYSLSRTWRLGNTVLRARHNKASPVDSILQHENGRLLVTGKVWQTVFLELLVNKSCSCLVSLTSMRFEQSFSSKVVISFAHFINDI